MTAPGTCDARESALVANDRIRTPACASPASTSATIQHFWSPRFA